MTRIRIMLVALVLLASVFGAFADSKADYGLQLDARWRGESDGRDMSSDTNMIHASALRSRLGVWMKQGDVKAYVQFQHPHTLEWNSSALATDNTVDVHQAFILVDRFLTDHLTMKLGRTELKYGDERLVGAVGWSNIGRVFDGVVFRYKADANWIDFFYTNQSGPGMANSPNSLFTGLWGRMDALNLEAYLLHKNLVGPRPDGEVVRTEARTTAGLYYKNMLTDQISTSGNAAYQFGTFRNWNGVGNSVDSDIGAWLFAWQVWYSMNPETMPAIGVGVDLTSGDDDLGDTSIGTFDNLYYTGHKFRGHMDLFLGSNLRGLRDVYFTIKMTSYDRLTTAFSFHNFAEMAAPSGSSTSVLGNEIDLDSSYKLKPNLSLGAGGGLYLPDNSNLDSALWGYLMLSTVFNTGK
ncbi:alginate export family protein [bacterium]|nr:alginate export family protein [bacterium]